MTAVLDHPIVLAVAVVFAAPVIWQIARSWFADIEEDAKEAAPFALLSALGGMTFVTWLTIKIFWFVVASGAILVTFYKIGSWIVELV